MSGMDLTVKDVVEKLKTDGSVTIKGFGQFTLKNVAARTRRNPKTGASVEAAGFKKISFKMSKSFRDELG